MRPFRQSTVVTIRIGPALDSTGAEYTGLVIGDLTLTKAGTSAAMASAATLTHIANGHYSLVTISGNTDTLGSLRIDCNKSTYQIPPVEGEVLPATVFDALVANAAGGANGLLLSDANNRVDLAKWIGTAPLALSSQQVQAIVPDTQKVDVNTIKTNPVVNGGTITFPTTATLASTTGAVGSVTGNVGGNVIGSVGSVTGLTVSNLDTTVSSRMATYTQPTGFLAATFPGTLASTTNITSASGVTLTSSYDFAKGTVAVTESYNADGSAPTPVQALMVIMQMLTEMAISSTTMTVKKLDGSTAFTLTLNDASTPTSVTRAT